MKDVQNVKVKAIRYLSSNSVDGGILTTSGEDFIFS